jgi:hypothetical protein
MQSKQTFKNVAYANLHILNAESDYIASEDRYRTARSQDENREKRIKSLDRFIRDTREADEYLTRLDGWGENAARAVKKNLKKWKDYTGVEWTPTAYDQLEWTMVALRRGSGDFYVVAGIFYHDVKRGHVRLEINKDDYYSVEEYPLSSGHSAFYAKDSRVAKNEDVRFDLRWSFKRAARDAYREFAEENCWTRVERHPITSPTVQNPQAKSS